MGNHETVDGLDKFDTTIVVKCPAVEAEALNKHEVFISQAEVAVVKQSSFLYNKGVRSYTLTKPSLLRYNLNLPLTEDRTIANIYSAQSEIGRHITGSDDTELIEHVLTADPDSCLEGSISFSLYSHSKAFRETALRLYRQSKLKMEGALKPVQEAQLLFESGIPWTALSPKEQVQFEKSIRIIGLMLRDDVSNITWRFSSKMPVSQLGCVASMSGETALISTEVFSIGFNMLVGTMYEEAVHIKKGYIDNSRGMQNFLLNELVRYGVDAHETN